MTHLDHNLTAVCIDGIFNQFDKVVLRDPVRFQHFDVTDLAEYLC